MSHVIKLMAVDDNELNLDIIDEALSDQYSLELVSSGDECLTKLSEAAPCLILMDVNMPNLNGYETCQKIKSDPETSNIPVIFVSALNNLDERIKGYEAGGEDFVSKPFEPKELSAKIEVTLKNRQAVLEKEQAANDAMSVAMTALGNASELGKVMQSLERIYACNTCEKLSLEILDVTESFGLHCLVQIRTKKDVVSVSSSGNVKPLELDLLEKLRSKGRIYSFKSRTIFNYEMVSILVKNMPEEGNLIDSLAILLNGIESQLKFITLEITKKNQTLLIQKMLQHTHKALEALQTKFEEHKFNGAKIIKKLLEDFEMDLISLGLDEDQEQYFLSVVDREMAKVMALYEFGEIMDHQFQEILDNFTKILNID
ncbi:hypothetical protein MNBD_GAMMA12-3637 [hydrothermal vent metagenome]|uniref:Response regulatory domain-containing protein n=1 Tax=hydrothermal vent metagenome TaxID=652676 RepID=A0A3B0YMJ3_9ZZZZ